MLKILILIIIKQEEMVNFNFGDSEINAKIAKIYV